MLVGNLFRSKFIVILFFLVCCIIRGWLSWFIMLMIVGFFRGVDSCICIWLMVGLGISMVLGVGWFFGMLKFDRGVLLRVLLLFW